LATAKTVKTNTVSYAKKFGLDPERAKLDAGLKNFDILKIVVGESKKKYDHEDSETGEIVHGKIDIVSLDLLLEDGTIKKVYAPNAPIVEACQNILKDPDFEAKPDGTLGVPCHIDEVIQGKGDKNRGYIAFK